jgi:transposase InsO family protein
LLFASRRKLLTLECELRGGKSMSLSMVSQETIDSLSVTSLFVPAEESEMLVEQITGAHRPQLKKKRADELGVEQIEIISERSLLMSLMDQGFSARAALARVPLNRPMSVSALLKLRTRFNKEGAAALKDGRWSRETEVRVMTSEVKKLIHYFFLDIAGGPKAVWKEVIRAIERIEEKENRKIERPSYSSVKRYIARLEEGVKLLKKGQAGIREWDKQGAPVISFKATRYSNELWQADHCFLPLWGKKKIAGVWKPVHIYFSDSFDDFSRAIPGVVISSRYPNRETVKLLYRFSILPKKNKKWKINGRPFIIKTDRGKDLICDDVRASLRLLEVEPEPNPAHYPNANGKIERFHRTINEGCLKRLPGHMSKIGTTIEAAEKHIYELLTVPLIREEIERWIVDEYHQTTHSETGRRPIELWEETVRYRSVAQHEDVLNLMLLRDGVVRTVRNTGIDFTLDGIRHRYWSPDCVHYWRSKVLLSHWPDDMESVLVYSTDTREFLFEAWDLRSDDPRYTIADIKKCRSEYRRGLVERLKQHVEDTETDDRPFKVQAIYAEIREEESKRQSISHPSGTTSKASESEDAFVIDLAKQIKQSRRAALVNHIEEQDYVF